MLIKSAICTICGKREAVTRDHIPPQGIFSKPLPNNLVTVPACSQCNNSTSAHDEKFKVYLSLYCGQFNPEVNGLIGSHALPTLEHNQKLNRLLISSMRPAYLSSSAGIIYERGWAADWDETSTKIVLERTVRGLYFHHFNEILGEETECRISQLDDNNLEKTISIFSKSSKNYIGERNEVVYMYACQKEDPLNSVWIFEFYGVLWFFCHTIPQNLQGKYEFIYRRK